MLLIVSACLIGRNCKYNGGNNRSNQLCTALRHHAVIPLCPECAGSLPVPRPPAELKGSRVIDINGRDVTAFFKAGIASCLATIAGRPIAGAILQERSPSCGVNLIYDGTFSNRLISGQGLFTKALKKQGIPVYTLKNYTDLLNLFK